MLKMMLDYVLVKVDDAETETTSGIVLTASTADKPCRGVVVDAGPGRVHAATGRVVEHGIAAGDRVVFPAAALGNKLEEDGVEYYVMTSDQIFGIEVK